MENEVAEPGAGAPGGPDDVVATGGCASCGAPMAADQDWCLTCGTAAPGRVDQRAGMRTVARVAVLTLALLVTAVGVSYAALTHGSKTLLVASTPVPAPVAPAPTTTATTATTTTAKPPAAPKPKPTTSSSPAPAAPDPTPTVTPDDSVPTDTPTPTTTVSPTPTPRVTPTTTTTKKTTGTATQITLAKDAIALYDPLSRAAPTPDPATLAALTDKDPSTVWTVSTAPSTDGMKVGLTIDLGTVRKAMLIKLQTPTPGFSVEIYGAPGATTTTGPRFPATVPDPGWTHLRNAADIGSVDGNADIHLGIHGKGVSKYRYLLVWLTHQPPVSAGTRDVPAGTSTTPVAAANALATTVPVTTQPATTPAITPPPTTTVPAPAAAPVVSIAELSVFG